MKYSFALFRLCVASIGIITAAVCIARAKNQEEVERGVTGSYEILTCRHMRTPRAVFDSWTCHGTFRPDFGGAPGFAVMQTDKKEEPRGLVTVMAARPSSEVVWLPDDVSSQKRWTLALSVILLTLPALVMTMVPGSPSVRKTHVLSPPATLIERVDSATS
jgi:hypothetical protein